MQRRYLNFIAWPMLIMGQFACGSAVLAERVEPNELLNRMAAAVQMTSYEGTVIRIQDGKAEALKVVHTVSGGVIREKVVAQEGSGLEIIRNGNEVHCILPDRKSVLVEEWDDQSTLFSTLPSSQVRFGSEYDVSIVREERVAGRQAILLAIRPHDGYRYGHRIWLDVETAFPLQTQLIGADGAAIEQVKFADISLNKEIAASALEPSVSTKDFRWLTQPSRHENQAIETEWGSEDLPRGFRPISTHGESLPGSGDVTTTHILYSDGLANVSVFISPAGDRAAEGPSRVGGSNSYSAIIEGYSVTAVGEVPAITVEQIATTMSLR
jgi:sigma-E factor negative regulatory protein RseB